MISDLSGARTPDVSLSTSRISTLRRINTQYTPNTPKKNVTVVTSNDSTQSVLSDLDFELKDENVPIEDTIRRFISVGDVSSAALLIDSVYAKECDNDGGRINLVKVAHYVKALTSVQEWMRVSAVIENSRLQSRHLVFAYFYINSLFHRRMFAEIPVTPIGDLLGQSGLPVKYPHLPGGMDISLSLGQELSMIQSDRTALDAMATELKLRSAIMLVYGRTFLQLENRESASKCLSLALFRDPHCIAAQQLLTKYKLVNEKNEAKFNKLVEERISTDSRNDPRVLVSQAEKAFSRGDAKAALAITGPIILQHGLYMDALLVHINSLVQLEDADALFLLAHRLVDSMPDHEYSWYAVALYYHVCNNSAAAKNFMNKATMMNTGFGEGWLAYGHILSADSENEQALNCYYRASRILERHFEPLLYVAMQYCKSGVELADQFLSDAARLAPTNPVVLHEQGTLAFNKKDFPAARTMLEKALRLVLFPENGERQLSDDKPFCFEEHRQVPVDVYWEQLINNLGHCARRIGLYEEAVAYHQRALLLSPRNVPALTSLSMCYACLGNMQTAMQFLHRALSISRYDEIARGALDTIVSVQLSFVGPPVEDSDQMEVTGSSGVMSDMDLDDLLQSSTDLQKRAARSAMQLRRCNVPPEMELGGPRTSSPSRTLNRERETRLPLLIDSPSSPVPDDVME